MKKNPIIPLVLIQAAVLFLSACGQKGPLPPADKIPPAVSLISPANGAQNVPVNCSVLITFSEEMDASTINEQTITLTTGNGNVPGSVTYSDKIAVFKPASDLNPATIHTVTVDGGVADSAGNSMATPFGYIFITGAGQVPTTISLSAPDVTYNANGIITIIVSSEGGIPAGYVSLSVDGGTAIVQELTGGSTVFTIPDPIAGSYALNAAYAAQGAFEASSVSGTLIVNQAATTATIAAPPVTYGTDGSVTVTVSSAAGIPTGNVSLSVDSGAATTRSLSNGSATFTIPGPSAGSHDLNATYAAQGNYGASSAFGTLGVGVGATTMTLSAPPVTYGTNGIVAVTVSSASGTPTGGVSLSVDGGAATVQELIGGSTTFTIPGPNAGSHTLNATYAAQGIFDESSASGTLIVNQAATTTNITAAPATYGADGIVTVTVSSAAGIPTGDVSLSVDGGAAMTQGLVGGSTTFTITSPSYGSHALNATYLAQGNYGASSASGTLGVGPGATTMTLSAPGVTYNANGVVTVTVSSVAATPQGDVSLSVDGGTAMTQTLSSGSTIFTIPNPSAGSHDLNATYAAQVIFGASSASGTLIVGQAATTTTIAAPPVTYGTDGIVTVTVSSAAGTPTGDVSLTVDGGAPMMQPLTNGSATFTIFSPSAGNHALRAAYAAQGNYGESSSEGNLGVDVVETTTRVSSNLDQSTYGDLVTVTATVTPSTATGTVTFRDFGATIGTGTLSGGQATFSTSTLTGGTHSITAVYSGDTNYSGSTSTVLSQTVNQAPTTTNISSDSNPSIYGRSVTFTATVAPSMATGTVTFKDGSTLLGTGTLSNGVATFGTSELTGGEHSITAEYGGDTNFTASTSSALSQTVNYIITASSGPHGTISPPDTVMVAPGTDITFTITPHNNYAIAGVLVDGVSAGAIPLDIYTYPFTNVNANHTIYATFQQL